MDFGKRPKPAQSTTTRGQQAEDAALAYLQRQGLRLIERNYRTPGRGGGEIDLILRDRDGSLVFVEVRSRNTGRYGGAGGSIGTTKQGASCWRPAITWRALGPPPAVLMWCCWRGRDAMAQGCF